MEKRSELKRVSIMGHPRRTYRAIEKVIKGGTRFDIPDRLVVVVGGDGKLRDDCDGPLSHVQCVM